MLFQTYPQLNMNKNPYEILHLEEDASYDDIKERYRHLTRTLHPDKQPVENYLITKRLFEQIDEAYKSISSPLRRFLFRQYGLPALKVLDEMPNDFQEFQVEDLSGQQIQRLKQLMQYMLYLREASFEMDRTKFVTKMLVNLTKVMKSRKGREVRRHTKRNISVPEIENCTFEYEMVLPELYGFSNTFALSQFTNNIRTDPKYSLGFSLSCARRLFSNYMLAIQTSVSTEQSSLEVGVDRICENGLHLKFTPISFHNWQLTNPKVGLEKSFSHYQLSTVTDFQSLNIELGESSQKKIGRSLKMYMESGSIGLMPRVEFQVNSALRIFLQLNLSLELNQQENSINMRPSINYGYKLVLGQDLKLELASSIGTPNFLQLSFISGKFRVSVPMITADTDIVKFQLIKVSTMLLTYTLLVGLQRRLQRNQRLRQRQIKQQESRLNQQKRELSRQISYVEALAYENKEKEVKHNGLIILKALIGESSKLQQIATKLKKLKIPQGVCLQEAVRDLQNSLAAMDMQIGDIRDQVEEVTSLVMSEVVGAQLVGYKLEEMAKFNPLIFQSARLCFLVLYIERGEMKCLMTDCKKTLNLGQKPQKLSSTLVRLFKSMMNFIA